MGELNFFLNRETLTTAVPYKQTDAALDPRTLFEPLRVMKRARRHALRAWELHF